MTIAAGLAALVFVLHFSLAQASGIDAAEVVRLLNQNRQAKGLDALKENPVLDQAAKAKAADMLKNDYFAHTSPQGKTPWDWFKKAGYGYKYAGENLAVNYTNAEQQQEAWMKSPSHRANILNGHYTETGVAVVEGKIDGESSILTVQLFGTPLVAAVSPPKSAQPAAAPAAVPAVKSAEVSPASAEAPVENMPTVKTPASMPIQVSQPAVPAIAPNKIANVSRLVAFGILGLTFLANALIFTRKSGQLLRGAVKEKKSPRKIQVKYEDLLQSIKINLRLPRPEHSARGRPG